MIVHMRVCMIVLCACVLEFIICICMHDVFVLMCISCISRDHVI